MQRKAEITDLTICRAFFAAWVFAYHMDLYVNFSAHLGSFAGFVRRGYLGVDGFFMLSGLILAYVHTEFAQALSGTRKFLGKRLARIYPVHLAVIVILGFILLVGLAHGMRPRDPQRFSISALLQNMFLVQGWGFASQGAWNYPAWSISTEWAGYLLFPVLCYLVSYFDWYVVFQLIILAFVVLGLIITRHQGTLNLTFAQGLIRFFPEFIIGISTARLLPLVADNIILRKGAIISGPVFLFFGLYSGFEWFCAIGLWLILAACAMQADAQRPAFFKSSFLRRLGLLSYAFYMSFAVAELITVQWFRGHGWSPAQHGLVFCGAMLDITLALALLLHVAVEQPCRRRVDRWLERPAI